MRIRRVVLAPLAVLAALALLAAGSASAHVWIAQETCEPGRPCACRTIAEVPTGPVGLHVCLTKLVPVQVPPLPPSGGP